jgi:xanthine/CO dehydrogenase XdhC/CoxF family maturation factor
VVHVRGSSYRRPGARVLLTAERWIAGSISSGCLEADVLRRGWRRTGHGGAVLVTYDSAAPDEVRAGLGLGCDGVVEVLLERTALGGNADPLSFVDRCNAEQRRGVMATVFRSAAIDVAVGARLAIATDGTWFARGMPEPVRAALATECARFVRQGGPAAAMSLWVGGASVDVLLEPVRPAPRLFVLGGGHDVVPVVDIARTVGWETYVCETSPRWTARERFGSADEVVTAPLAQIRARIDASERPLAVVMAHDYDRDRDALGMVLVSRSRYIGVLGPRRRTARMLEELGWSEASPDERLHAPAGLELGAESPAETALAIVAEMQAVLTRSDASSLHLRTGRIHADPMVGAAGAIAAIELPGDGP